MAKDDRPNEERIIRRALIRWATGKTGYRSGAEYAAYRVNKARAKMGIQEKMTGEKIRLTTYFRLLQKRLYHKK